MKKYRFLKEGESVQHGDECFDEDFNSGTWRVIGEVDGDEPINKMEELTNEYRRPIPYTGKVAFLVNYSPIIRVVIDTTGLTDEQIDIALVEAAKAKHCYEHQQYMNDFHDNIDWEQTKEDEEVPYEEEEKIPANYRYLEAGEVIKSGDEWMNNSNEWGLANQLIGMNKDEIINCQIRRPITEPRYRPFKEGDVIEEGDQYRFSDKCEWSNLSDPYGQSVDSSVWNSPDFRKLIK